jgi:hypothetical protein
MALGHYAGWWVPKTLYLSVSAAGAEYLLYVHCLKWVSKKSLPVGLLDVLVACVLVIGLITVA